MREFARLMLTGALLAPTAAFGAQTGRVSLPLQLRAPWTFHETARLRLGKDAAALPSAPVRFGPIVFESRAAHAGAYRVDGMDVLGASLSGTVDGRGAKIELNWRDN